jgi:hypothetical protein
MGRKTRGSAKTQKEAFLSAASHPQFLPVLGYLLPLQGTSQASGVPKAHKNLAGFRFSRQLEQALLG